MTSLLDVWGVDWAVEEEDEDGDEYALCIWWRRAGGGGFELGGARLWSVADPLTTTPAVGVPVLVVVECAFTSSGDMLGELLLDGVESAWLDAVLVEDPGDDNSGGRGDGEVVVGIHDEREYAVPASVSVSVSVAVDVVVVVI